MTLTHSGRTTGTAYWYKVKANTAYVSTSYSTGASLTAKAKPAAPTGFGQTGYSSTAVTLAWTASPAVGATIYYKIQNRADTTASWADVTGASALTGVVTFTHTGLTAGTMLYQIQSTNSAVSTTDVQGWTAYSATIAGAPSAPTTLTQVVADFLATEVTVNWVASTPFSDATTDAITAYQCQYSTQEAGTYADIASPLTANGTTLKLKATGLTAGQYWFKVRAKTATVYSDWSTATTLFAATVPGAAGTPTQDGYAATTIKLVWTAAANNGANVENYTVQQSTTLAGTYTNVGTTVGPVLTFTHTVAAGTYFYKVLGTNVVGAGAATTAGVSMTAAAPPSAPTAIAQKADATTPWTASSVTMTWTAATAASDGTGDAITKYEMHKSSTNTATSTWAAVNTNGFTASGTVVELADATSVVAGVYFYKVRAHTATLYGPWSTVNFGYACAVPGVPVIAAQLTADYSMSEVKVAWSAATANGCPVTSYTLQWAITNSATLTDWADIGSTTAAVVNASTAVVTTATALTLKDELTTAIATEQSGGRYYKVKATNGAGDSAYSSGAQLFTAAIPAAPVAAVSGTSTADLVTIGWTAPSMAGNGKAITGYNVKYSLTSKATGTNLLAVATNTTTNPAAHNTSNGVPDGWLYYTVQAINAVGTSVQSNELTVLSAAGPQPTVVTVGSANNN